MLNLHRPKPSHGHHSHGEHRPENKKRLLWCILITTGMMVIEIIGGLITNSLALISDAGHMFTHIFSLGVSYFAIVIASRPEDPTKTYGYYRIEILAALLNGLTLLIVSGVIFYVGANRILHPVNIRDEEMFVVALIGLIVNLLTAAILHKSSREDINVRGAFFHMLGDTLSSVGVVGVAVILHYTNWIILDPIVSILIAVVILIWALKLLRDSIYILMESTPKHINLNDVAKTLKNEIKEIREVHDIHIWEITSKMYTLTAHILVDDCRVSVTTDIIRQCNALLNERFDIEHATLQVECQK